MNRRLQDFMEGFAIGLLFVLALVLITMTAFSFWAVFGTWLFVSAVCVVLLACINLLTYRIK